MGDFPSSYVSLQEGNVYIYVNINDYIPKIHY